MPRPKPTKEDLKERKNRAKEWQGFMKANLFTEVRLAETLGICRRTVQMIKAGKVSPQPGTLRLFNALKMKYEQNKADK